MKHRFANVLLGASFLVSLGLLAGPAHGQAKDAAATKLADDALNADYLAMNFDAAVAKLEKALTTCGAKGCSPKVLGRIHRDLGVVYIAGLNNTADGKAEFVAALTADPSVTLDKDLATDAVLAVFEEVKTSMGGSVTEPDGAETGTGDTGIPGIDGEEPAPVEVPESGDLVHVAPTESAVLTPLPIYTEVASGTELTRLQVRYQSPTSRDWKTAVMKTVGMGFGVEIPCTDVGSSPGEFRYYLQGFAGEDAVSFSGSAKVPHKVQIVAQLTGDAPTLPGEAPPARCETEECVPGMVIPGCPMPLGEMCTVDEDCESGLVCSEETCQEKAAPVKPKAHWVSLAFQQDFMLFPAEKGICSGGNDYECFFAGDLLYTGLPDTDSGNELTGGFGLATQRVVLGYDYRLPFGLALGAQGGFAFGGGPETPSNKFNPLHAEARVAYYFKVGALEPYAVLAGGLTQVDAKVTVSIRQTQSPLPIYEGQPDCIITDPDTGVAGPPCLSTPTNVDAWRRAGGAFVSLGGGARYLIKDRFGPFLELRGGRTFPASSTVFAARLGMSVGF